MLMFSGALFLNAFRRYLYARKDYLIEKRCGTGNEGRFEFNKAQDEKAVELAKDLSLDEVAASDLYSYGQKLEILSKRATEAKEGKFLFPEKPFIY